MGRNVVSGAALGIALIHLAACHSSMVAPSGSGATINGAITSTAPGPADEAADEAALSGLMVSIVGSSTQVMVDSSNHFTLTGVPGGDVVLRFQGTGVNATVTVPAVEDGEQITISVSIATNAATLVSDDRSTPAGSLEQLEGQIESLPPVSAAGTVVIDGTVVEVNGSTTFENGSAPAAFSDLALGIRVHVSGKADGAKILATDIDIQNTNATRPVIVNGIVSGFTGTASAFQFTVNGTLVKGTTATGFTGNSAFNDLANGVRVEVEGEPRNGFVTAESIHVN